MVGNKLYTPLSNIDLPIPLDRAYNPREKLIDIIGKPIWMPNGVGTSVKEATETLIPDIKYVGRISGEYHFVIFDAKYYNIQLEEDKQLRSYPGVGDVTKQYLYQLAFKDFFEKHNINFLNNFFLMPTEKTGYIYKGKVKLEMLKNLGLQDIEVWQLSATEMYSNFLSHRIIDMHLLNL